MVRGRTVRQARVGLGDLFEEHFSRQGFFGPAAMLYHENPIKDALRVEGPINVGLASFQDLEAGDAVDPEGMPTKLLFNDQLSISVSRRAAAMPYLMRNIDADSLYFVHRGTGVIATEFGPLAYEPGDIVLLQKGVTYRVLPDEPLAAIIVESIDPIRMTEHQQVGRHAPFDPTVLTIPEITRYDWPAQDEWEIRYKHGDDYSRAFFADMPFDLVGWKGDCFPFKLNVRDVRPITSERLHLAPSAWSIFEAAGFMLVGFLPMMIVSDDAAEELPSRHRNVDSEEVLLIRARDGNQPEVFGHFPQGITHGPDDRFREQYAPIRRQGMPRMTNGISIDSYRRLKRTDAFSSKLGMKMERPVPASTDR